LLRFWQLLQVRLKYMFGTDTTKVDRIVSIRHSLIKAKYKDKPDPKYPMSLYEKHTLSASFWYLMPQH
jgi:hypothetical protein